MMEFPIYVIHPTSRKSRLKCSDCYLAYSVKDYKTLFDSKKLVYFKYTSPEKKRYKVLCHECLFKTVAKDTDGESCFLKIIDPTTEVQYNCEFIPEDNLYESGNENLPEPSGIWPDGADF